MSFTLVSSNIRFDSSSDGAHSWVNRRELLAGIFHEVSSSIIGTQEGRIDQIQELKNLLTGFELIDQHRPWIGERMYPCLFVKSDLFEILDSGDVWLSNTPDIIASKSFNSAFPRLMTWAKLQIKNSVETILIINTHLDHILEKTREEQIEVLCQETLRIWDKNSFLIIMGDFNTGPDSLVRKKLTGYFPNLVDTWKYINKTEEASFHAFQGSIDYAQRIDWIMADSRIEILNSSLDKRQFNQIYPSDHYPVITQIKL